MGWGPRSGSGFAAGTEREECDSRSPTLPALVLALKRNQGPRFPTRACGSAAPRLPWAARPHPPSGAPPPGPRALSAVLKRSCPRREEGPAKGRSLRSPEQKTGRGRAAPAARDPRGRERRPEARGGRLKRTQAPGQAPEGAKVVLLVRGTLSSTLEEPSPRAPTSACSPNPAEEWPALGLLPRTPTPSPGPPRPAPAPSPW